MTVAATHVQLTIDLVDPRTQRISAHLLRRLGGDAANDPNSLEPAAGDH